MPGVAFAANFLWVMVIGLLGPSIPAIVEDLGITYGQAGLFFTMLSLGSLFGTFFGALASDYLNRKYLFLTCTIILLAGLAGVGFVPGYTGMLVIIFLFSLFGSPIGAIGQSIMLHMYPEKREKYVSLQTTFAALGSFLAPLLITLNFAIGLNWRWPFIQTAGIALLLALAVFSSRIPAAAERKTHLPLKTIFANSQVRICAILIFLSISLDIGFSYWLAEYFASELHVSLGLSSAVVGIYLAGIITGRLLVPLYLRRMKGYQAIQRSLILAAAAMVLFLTIPNSGVKAVLCYFYGLGIAPLFPLMMARGASAYPDQPGAVTGFLFGAMSLGGMVFPLLLGFLAERFGIERSYYFIGVFLVGVFLIITFWVGGRQRKSRTN
ncbi:MAG: MFS transporter [Spirochaetales bacterium]|jgi:MFS transporter, FHS family, glucose/mannose:H+ symporter|nr:MFS transporter [Spirochaetales bacterium]